MAQLIVIRHPPVLDSTICYGQINPPCELPEPEFEALVRELRELTELESIRLWSSPAERCLLVSKPLSELFSWEPSIDERLWEISMGEFEGRLKSELEKDEVFLDWMANWQTQSPPGGETMAQLTERVRAWLLELNDDRPHVVVAHAGVVRALMVILLGKSWPEALKTAVPHLTPNFFSLP